MNTTKVMMAVMSPPRSMKVLGLLDLICQPSPMLPLEPIAARSGLMMVLVNAVIKAANASAMTRATATSTTLPHIRKFLNPFILAPFHRLV